MTPSEHQEAKELFGRVLELEPHVRASILDEACVGRPQLRHEVEALLVAYQRAGVFIDAPLIDHGLCPEGFRTAETMMGRTLGPYRIDAVIGEGGMGTVCRALDTKLNRPVAIKFLSNELADAAARRRFQREAQMASSLNHPHILTVHDAGEFEGRQYLVTEFIDGGTLKDWARVEKRTWRQIVELLAGVADGLAAAHVAGITHRDIKPANILVAKNGYAKLADFGLAKLTEGTTPEDVTLTLTGEPTRPGVIVGTVAYMSPEQASGRSVDARSDIFSFGVLLYELLAGRRPFAGATELEVLKTIIHGAPQPLAEEDAPAALRAVVEKALEKDPAERYQAMREMVVDLRRLARQTLGRPAGTRPRLWWITAGAGMAVLITAGVMQFRFRTPAEPARLEYTQITNFTDSAVAPALSPDGRMVAFYRSNTWFHSPDQIYVKMLPNGEPVQLTNDPRLKYGVAFSPDGSRIAYTVEEPGWQTFTVSPLGGEPSLLLSNAAGLTWLDQRRVLFSEIRTGTHMGIVTAMENRSEYRKLYFPQHERAMAHFSYASPDRKWALVMEMDPVWQPCRVIPLDGSSAGRQVGPQGPCTSAAWSPDGKWMYFGAEMDGNHHLWRQRFPAGQPEQITSGPTEEDGVAVAPDGRSLITSIGLQESAVWIHDDRGDRPLSSEGHVASMPASVSQATNYLAAPSARFSSDGKFLFYLMQHDSPASPSELWRRDVESGKSEAVLRGMSMVEYDISNDGKEVVFSTQPPGKASQLWLAHLDGSSPPRLIASTGERAPRFGPDAQVVFQFTDGKANYIGQIRKDGSDRSKVIPYPILGLHHTISPDRRWVMAGVPLPNGTGTMAVPIGGGSSRRICEGYCPVAWAPDEKFLYVGLAPNSQTTRGKTLAIPIPAGETLPNLPSSGIRGPEDAKAFPGARLLDAWGISPGPDPSVFAYTKTTAHRNLFRIPLRDQ